MKLSHFLELSKIRMVPMVLVTGVFGFVLGGQGIVSWQRLTITLLGMALISCGAAALNNLLERDTDALMVRTQNRVLPSGKMLPLTALIFGVSVVLLGDFLILSFVNLLTAFLLLMAAFLYALVYTPMKRWSVWNTFVGAIPGAIPPLAGWTAATGRVGLGAWLLFFILFTWQHPHFYAIALMYKNDYARAKLKMLPVVEAEPRWTMRCIIAYTILMILVSTMPAVIGMVGPFYLLGVLLAGLSMLKAGLSLWRTNGVPQARSLFRQSLVYLPVVFLLIVIDRMIL